MIQRVYGRHHGHCSPLTCGWGSFEQIEAVEPGDLVYLDPPYFPISATSSFTGYSRHSFGEAEQIRLAEIFAQLAQRGAWVMLSNSDCPFIRELYGDWPTHVIQAGRSINSKGSKRGKINEVLVTSYDPAEIEARAS